MIHLFANSDLGIKIFEFVAKTQFQI